MTQPVSLETLESSRHTCTAYGCAVLVGEGSFLCRDHIVELDDHLRDVPALRDALAPAEQVAKAPNANPGGSSTPGSKPPFNLELIVLDEKLASLPASAHETAHHDPEAGKVLRKASLWVESARAWVYGRPEARVIGRCECGGDIITDQPRQKPTEADPDPTDCGTCQQCGAEACTLQSETRRRISDEVREQEPEPMTAAQARAWVARNAGVKVSADDVKNWAKAKKIRQDRRAGHAPRYFVSDLLRVHFTNCDTRRRVPMYS